MDEQSLLTWFEQIDGRVSELIFPNRTNVQSAWTALFIEMETALKHGFAPSDTVLEKWKDAMARERQALQDDHAFRLQLAQDDLIAIFQLAHRLLKEKKVASSKEQPILTTPSINPQQGIQLLQRQIEKGKSLLEERALIQEDDYHAWVSTTFAVLEKAFGTASGKKVPFLNIGYGPGSERRSLNAQLSFLRSCIEQFELDIELALPSVTSSEVSVSRPYVFISYSHIDSGCGSFRTTAK